MDDLAIIDRFTETFSRYIDSGFGLLAGDVAFLTTVLVAIDITMAGIFWAMHGDERTILAATDEALADAAGAVRAGGAEVLGLLGFDCMSRTLVLDGDGVAAEAARIAGHAGPAPMAVVDTWGEIARRQGISGFLNRTLVVLAVG